MNNLLNIAPHVPDSVSEICSKLWQEGISCTAVGGIPRDLMLGRLPLKDWDFEVRPIDKNAKDFDTHLKNVLGKDAQELGFGVYRISSGNFQFEFSIPRLETFPNSRPLGHKDFSVTLDPTLDFKQAFIRRDLTINAIGLDYQGGKWVVVDPFGGVEDLKNKLIKPCSETFVLDPVRVLRAIRFKQLFNFEYSKETLLAFEDADLSLATEHYLLYESSKAGFFPYMDELLQIVERYKISIPEEWQELDFLKANNLAPMFLSTDQLLLMACWRGDWGLSDMGKLERLLKLRRGRAKHYLTGFEMASQMSQYDWQELAAHWATKTWSDLHQEELFVRCLEYHKHWETWTPQEESMLLKLNGQLCGGLISWRKVFGRELSGKNEFSQWQEKHSVMPNQRSLFRLWCHLQTR